jgi:hypothetical protein
LDRASSEPDRSRRRDLLRDAVAANGRSSEARIYLGLDLEQGETHRDLAAAEEALLEAARLDRQHLPSWTLANFYFRQGRVEEFWRWAARAGNLTYDDYRPLMTLADRMEPDGARLLNRLHGNHRLTRTYLDFAIGQHRMETAQQAARALLRFRDPADRDRVLGLAERQSASGREDDARELRTAIHENLARFPAGRP